MKKIVVLFVLFSFLLLAGTASAVTKVKSYYKKSTGTYVNSYYRSSPNKTKLDNYSTKGNYNPYTGKKGTKNIYKW